MHTMTIDQFGQLTRYLCISSILTVFILSSHELTIVTPSTNKILLTSYSFLLVSILILCPCLTRLHVHAQQHFDNITMAMQLTNGHVTYYHRPTSLILSIWSSKVGTTHLFDT